MMDKCPGARHFLQPKPEIIICPHCGRELEIWTDEVQRTCSACGGTVRREQAPACLEWCRHARKCVGQKTYDTFIKNKMTTVKQKLLDGVGKYFGNRSKRAKHSRMVASLAERLLEEERGDWHIVIAASILHDIGTRGAERKHGSSAPLHQERESAATITIRNMLLDAGFKNEDIEEVCCIIARHHPPATPYNRNGQLLHDANLLANLYTRKERRGESSLEGSAEKELLTKTGKRIASLILAGQFQERKRDDTNDQDGKETPGKYLGK